MSEDVSAGRLLLEVVADTSGLRSDLKAKLDAISRQLKVEIAAQVKVNAAQAKAEIDAATRDRVIKVTAKAVTTQARADLDSAAQDRTTTIKAKADTAQARADLDAVARDRTTTIKAKTDKSSVSSAISDIGQKLTGFTIPVAMGSGLITAVGAAGQLAGSLVAVAAAGSQAAGVIGALPGLLLTAGQAAGAITLGFSGISRAVSAFSAVQATAGTSATESAQQIQAAQDRVRTSAQALQNAQIGGAEQVASAQHAVAQSAQALGDAQYSAVQSIRQALHDEQQSVIAVADAQYNAAQSTGTALHSEQQAVIALADARYNAAQSAVTSQHSYTDALYGEQQAQLSLTQARASARQNLIQTSFDLRDAVLGEKQAALSLGEAKIRLQEINQSAAATPQQQQQAQLDLQQAQLSYDESINKAGQAAQAKKKTDKAGVDGSQQVIQARHEEADAAFSLQQADQAVARARVQATRSVREAEYELKQSLVAYARAQVEAVRSVREAEYQEAQSFQAYARARVTAAESVNAAEYQQQQSAQALGDTRRTTAQQAQNAQIDYTEALKAARSPTLGVSAAQTALNKAMAGLTPAGRALVAFIDKTLIPRYRDLRKATAEALLPGVTSGLRAALPVIGTVQKGLTGTGRVLGGVASRFGSWLGSAGVNSDLSGVMAVNTRAVGAFADAALHVVDALRNVSVVAEPLVTDISRWADKAAKTADAWSKTGRDSGSLAAFFDRAWKSATQLGKIVENLGGFIGHLFGAAAPSGTSLLGSLVDATGKLDKWAGSSGGQAKLQQFFQNTVPVARQFGDLLVKAAGVLGQLIGSFGGGQLDGLFSVLNLALSILSTLTGLPGFGQVVQWVLILSGAGAGLGMVASKITAIGKGLSVLTKFTGLDKLTKALGLGDTVGAAAGGGLKNLGGKILGQKATAGGFAVNAAGEATQVEATAATGLRGAAATAGGWFTAAGQGAASMAGSIKGAVGKAAGYLAGGTQAAAGFAAQFGSKMASAAGSVMTTFAGGVKTGITTAGTWLTTGIQSAAGFATQWGQKFASAAGAVATFVASSARQLATGAKNLALWLGEQLAAGAAYIAEQLLVAAAATTAFVAENLATLGIIAVIGLLVAAIVYLATHWSQVWRDIKKWAGDAWRFIYDGIGKYLLVLLGPAGLIILGIIEVSKHWSRIWGDIKGVAEEAWSFISRGFTGALNGIKSLTATVAKAIGITWAGIKAAFEDPAKFIVNIVYDNGIAKIWNWVASKLKMPTLPTLKMREGGRVPGTGLGDHVPILAEPGERVLSRAQVASFGGGSLGAGHAALDGMVGRGGSQGPGYQNGGIVNWLTGLPGDIGGLVSSGLSGLWTSAKFLAQLVTNPGGALKQIMAGPLKSAEKIAGSPLGKMIAGIPGAWVKGMIARLSQTLGLSGGAGGKNVTPPAITGTVKDWFAKATQLTGVPATWIPDLEIIGQYESSNNPLAINNTDRNAAAGDPSRGIMQVIMSTFRAFHQAGTSGNIYDPVANVSAAINYIKQRYHSVFDVPGIKSLAAGGTYVGYDTGGPLKPGYTPVLNATGRDEWVLTPHAVDLLGGPQAVARLNMTAGLYRSAGQTATAAAGTAGGKTTATVNVYPSPGMTEEHIGQVAARKIGMMLGT